MCWYRLLGCLVGTKDVLGAWGRGVSEDAGCLEGAVHLSGVFCTLHRRSRPRGPKAAWPQTVLQRHRVATMGLALCDRGRRARYARLPERGRPCGPHLFCSPGPRCVSTLDPRGPVPRLAWVPRGSPAGPAFPSWSWAPDSRPLLAPCTRSSPRMPALGAPTSPRPQGAHLPCPWHVPTVGATNIPSVSSAPALPGLVRAFSLPDVPRLIQHSLPCLSLPP